MSDIKPKTWIKSLPEYVAGRTIEEIKQKYNLKEVYKLASNENILGPCPQVIKYLKENLSDINYYPDADALKVRSKIAEHYGVDLDNVIMGNGTDQIIEMICDCFIGVGDNIVIADPNFLIYEKAALKCGGSVKKIPLLKNSFKQDIFGIAEAIDNNTKIIFLASPHNPTGTIITKDEFEKLLTAVKEKKSSSFKKNGGILIVMDEAYYEYVEDEFRINTIQYIKNNENNSENNINNKANNNEIKNNQINNINDNKSDFKKDLNKENDCCKNSYNYDIDLIVLRTFSKIFGLAGLRIGYGIADKKIINILNKIRLPFNISIIAHKAAVKAIENYWYVDLIRDEIIKQKEIFYKTFDFLGLSYIKSYANFILVNLGSKCDKIIEKLLQHGFIIRPGKNLGIPGYARITISTPEVNEKFLNIFKKILKEKI